MDTPEKEGLEKEYEEKMKKTQKKDDKIIGKGKGKEQGKGKGKSTKNKTGVARAKKRSYVQIQNLNQKSGIVWYVVELTKIQRRLGRVYHL